MFYATNILKNKIEIFLITIVVQFKISLANFDIAGSCIFCIKEVQQKLRGKVLSVLDLDATIDFSRLFDSPIEDYTFKTVTYDFGYADNKVFDAFIADNSHSVGKDCVTCVYSNVRVKTPVNVESC